MPTSKGTSNSDKGTVSDEKIVPNFTDGKDDKHVEHKDVPPPKADPETVPDDDRDMTDEEYIEYTHVETSLPRAQAEMPAFETDPRAYTKMVEQGFIVPEDQPYDENS